MKKLLFIILTLFTLQSFAQTNDTVYVKVRNGIPGVYNLSMNSTKDSLVYYAGGIRYAIASGTGSNDADSLSGHPGSYYEPAFSKNTAFNKNFGITTGTVMDGKEAIDSLKILRDSITSLNIQLKQKVDTSYRDVWHVDSSMYSDTVNQIIGVKKSLLDSVFALIHKNDTLPDYPNDSVAVVDGGLHRNSHYRTGNIMKIVVNVPAGYTLRYEKVFGDKKQLAVK
jgi:hypothetical protein